MDLDFLKNFIKQSFQKDSQETKDRYPEKLFDLFINVSFGFGRFANIPHLGFYKSNSKKKASKGFFPVFLHYREKGILILSYGLSDTEKPEQSWNEIIHDSAPKIKDFKSPCGEFDLINTKKKEYGESMVFNYYKPKLEGDDVVFFRGNKRISEESICEDIKNIVISYKNCSDLNSENEIEPKIFQLKASERYTKYELDNIIEDGSFLSKEKLREIINRFKEKKNLILQGPPGTGKTWLAKRLAMVLIGREDLNGTQIKSVQFHPNLSYEDFVRGWRPGSNEKLILQEGIFMSLVKEANKFPNKNFVIVIDEINRGNPAQIFGELLTLIESTKRNPKDAIQLCYQSSEGDDSAVYLPDNLYILGTMNIADRSLALVDMAFRRRFAFINLDPNFNDVWRYYVVNKREMDLNMANFIQRTLINLNTQISSDPKLGKDFQVGHSFFTPNNSLEGKNSKDWFKDIVKTEIKPLLEEYWFDSLEDSEKAIAQLTSNL